MKCPTCGGPVDAKEHRGLIINARASLSAELIRLEEQYERNKNKCPKDMKGSLEWAASQMNLGQTIIDKKKELAELRALENE